MGQQKHKKAWILYLIVLIFSFNVQAKEEPLKTFLSSNEFLTWCNDTHKNPDFCNQILKMHKAEGFQKVEWFPSTFIDRSVIFKDQAFIGCSDIHIFSVGYLQNFIYNFRVCDIKNGETNKG